MEQDLNPENMFRKITFEMKPSMLEKQPSQQTPEKPKKLVWNTIIPEFDTVKSNKTRSGEKVLNTSRTVKNNLEPLHLEKSVLWKSKSNFMMAGLSLRSINPNLTDYRNGRPEFKANNATKVGITNGRYIRVESQERQS